MTNQRWKVEAISGIHFQTSRGLWWDRIYTFRKGKIQFIDALATLASIAQIDYRDWVQLVCIRIRNSPAYYCSVGEEIDEKPCVTPSI
jgi:hypothetical protein